MLNQLFINACIIVTFTFVSNVLLKDLMFQSKTPKWLRTIATGIPAGLLGLLLMYNSIRIPDSTLILDLRHLALVVAAFHIGFWPTLVAAGVMSVGRLFLLGINTSSLWAVINMTLIAIISSLLIRWLKTPRQRWWAINIYALAQTSLVVGLQFPDPSQLWSVMPLFAAMTLIGAACLRSLILYLYQANEKMRVLEEYSTKDHLTGLNNVRQFDALLHESIREANEHQSALSLLMIDIDHFKRVNDTYGHPAGDAVLRQLADVLTRSSRSFDTVFRNGGEEFSVLLRACHEKQALEIGERLRRAVEECTFVLPDEQQIRITVSVGVGVYSDQAMSPHQLLQQADDGLYQAKRTGRNRVCINPADQPLPV